VASKIMEKIVEGASEVFARQGYFGSSTREIAITADVTEPSIYRLFLSKEKLFKACLAAAKAATLSPEQFLIIISGEEEEAEAPVLVARAVRRWYNSLSAQSARLLMHAGLSDNREWSRMAYEPLDKIINILGRRLEKDMRVPRTTATVAARTLILALFQFKLARPLLTPSDGERDAVDRTIQQWLQGLSRRPS
jgi:AcrR family transcriptional regulator